MNAHAELEAIIRASDVDYLDYKYGPDREVSSIADKVLTKHRIEVDAEIVRWLVKKAREFRAAGGRQRQWQADAIDAMASKLSRGAVRPNNMLGAPTRAEVLRRMADAAEQGEKDTAVAATIEYPHQAPCRYPSSPYCTCTTGGA